jgi:hypothetical protein
MSSGETLNFGGQSNAPRQVQAGQPAKSTQEHQLHGLATENHSVAAKEILIGLFSDR